MFRKVIAFGLFEMIQKQSEDPVPRSGFGLLVESGTAAEAVTSYLLYFHLMKGQIKPWLGETLCEKKTEQKILS